jgi:hypothetical protein
MGLFITLEAGPSDREGLVPAPCICKRAGFEWAGPRGWKRRIDFSNKIAMNNAALMKMEMTGYMNTISKQAIRDR